MTSTFQKYRLDYFFILCIIVASLLNVFFNIGEMPPATYPWSDESDVASDGVATVRDGWQFHYPAQLAGGPLAIWLDAGWISLFGKGLTGLRILNGLVNLVSALLLYLVIRQLPFASRPDWPFSRVSFSQWLAVTSTLLFTVSTWILGLARIATPNWSLVPPMTTLAFYYLWRALNTHRLRYFIATGVMLGALFYGYIPGYCVPLVPAIFLGLIWFDQERQKQLSFPPSARLYLLPFPVALIVATPIFIFFALHPDAVLQRVVQLIHTNELSLRNLLAENVIDTLSSFGFWPNWLLQGRFEHVAFDPLGTVLFIIGSISIFRRRRENAYLFLLIWWLVMVAPAFFSRSASTGFIFEVWRRGIGAQPVSFVFVAHGVLAVFTGMRWLQQWLKRRDRSNLASEARGIALAKGRQAALLFSLTVIMIVATGGSSYWLYFERWAKSGVIPLFFPSGPVRLVEWMEEESHADTLFVFPRRPRVSPTTRPEIFTVRYLYDGPAMSIFPVMEEATVGQVLAEAFERKPTVVNLMLHDRILVDPKDYFSYVLGVQGDIIARSHLSDFFVTTYRFRPDASFEASLEPVDVRFGQTLRLTGQRIQPIPLAAGQILGLALRWTKPLPVEADYNVSLTLYDSHDYEWVKSDKPLMSESDYLTTRHWSPEEDSTVYYTLPVPPDAPPGSYTVRAVAYNVETGALLPPAEGQIDLSYPLAEINLLPAPAAGDPVILAIPTPLKAQFPDGLTLLGAKAGASANRPGDQLWVTLWWQAKEALTKDVGLDLALAGLDGEPLSLFDKPQPLLADYPTTAWPTGQIYRANYRLLLPATLETGDYRLVAHLYDLATTESLAGQQLFPISVKARRHTFDAPALANQLNIDFDDTIRLLSFELEERPSELSPKQEMRLRLQWQALREIGQSYKIFLHLTDAAGQIISQVDTLPQQGAVPTTGWVPGEIIEDELVLTTPPAVPSAYRLVVGLYNEKTGERLLTGPRDHVVLIEDNTAR